MALDQEMWNRLASYLSGNTSDGERASIENWMEDSEENKAVFLEAKKIWENAGQRLYYGEIDSTRLLEELRSRIDQDLQQGQSITMPGWRVWKIAAALTLIALSYFVLRWATRENITVESGNKVVTLYLPDSTKVWLNINSKLSYPRKFRRRHVDLSGEALLSVRKDTSAFTVVTSSTITSVVGTAFNIKANGNSSAILTVAEGVVNFSNKASNNKKLITVRAGEKATFSEASGLLKGKNDDPAFAKWREQNNPAFEQEKNNPADFLSNEFTWRKNQINQSVIEGTLANSASLAAYTKIVLNVTYTRPDGTQATVDLTIHDTVYPGRRIEYTRRLLDIFTDTKSVVVRLKSADVNTTNSF